MSAVPGSALQTEAAMRIGLLVRQCGYELEATPRANGADLAAGRDGTVWATFHLDVDRRRPLNLLVGATVWGGARVALEGAVPFAGEPARGLEGFVRDRLALACRKGRAENPDHCAACPDPSHRRA